MNRPKPIHVVVIGRGRFPTDMLRYDGACPATESDSVAIEATGLRAVRLESRVQPTIGRWSSFGWVVVSHDAHGKPRGQAEVEMYTGILLASLPDHPEGN